MVAANCLFTEGSSSLRNWVAVKELNLSYFIEETPFFALSILIYIYVYTPIMAAKFKFLNSNPGKTMLQTSIYDRWGLIRCIGLLCGHVGM